MRVTSSFSENTLTFDFHAEDTDAAAKQKLARTTCRFFMPDGWEPDAVHPDARGLAVILLAHCFSGPQIRLPFAVSAEFASLVKRLLKIDLSPADSGIAPRKCQQDARPGLNYSGGVDSTAALLLMPKSTRLFYLDRIYPAGELIPTKYDKSHALFACQYLAELGRPPFVVSSDFEYLKDPVGLGVDLANGIPALLLSDFAALSGIGYGMVAESAYRTGHAAFEDYEQRWHYKTWGSLFAAVDVPLILPTAGISEVGTSRIVLESCHQGLAQSCVRGGTQSPCMACWKCFRKTLLEQTLAGYAPPADELERLFAIREAMKYLTSPAIKHGNVLTWITSKFDGSHTLMECLKKKVGGHLFDVSWMEQWYSPSRNLIPAFCREHVEGEILRRMEAMDAGQARLMRAWDSGAYRKTDVAKEDHDAFVVQYSSVKLGAAGALSTSLGRPGSAHETSRLMLSLQQRIGELEQELRNTWPRRVLAFFKKCFAGKYPFRRSMPWMVCLYMELAGTAEEVAEVGGAILGL